MNKRTIKVFLILFILFLSYLAFFYKLDIETISVWDEARNSINAIEMSENRNFLVTTFEGEVDMWNTKPPLLIIIQSVFISLFGLSEFSVRLPSAIAATLTVFFLYFFISKYTKSDFIAFFSSIILLTTPGLFDHHGVRTADYEATLMLFCSLYSFFYLCYIETKKIKYLYIFSITFTIAFMTKSAASLLFIPALLIYTIYRRRLIYILKSRDFYISLLIPVLIIGGYYFYREILNPGYLKIIYNNEFGGRYFSALEGHREESLFYLKLIINSKLKYWFFISMLGIVFTFFEKNKRIKRLFIYLSLLSFIHLLIISIGKTKLHWYTLPEYPFWSVMAAISIYQILNFIFRLIKNKIVRISLTTVIVLIVFFFPIKDMILRIKYYSNEVIRDGVNVFIRDELTNIIDKDYDKITVFTTMPYQYIIFYRHVLQRKGYNIQTGRFDNITTDSFVLLDEREIPKPLIESLNILFFTEKIREYKESVILFKIIGKRSYEEALEYVIQQILLSEENKNEIKERSENANPCFISQLRKDADLIVKNAISLLTFDLGPSLS